MILGDTAGEVAGANIPLGSVPVLDGTTKSLSKVWRDLLNLESIGPDENFFDLGGDSSLAVQMFAQIEKVFNLKLPVATLYEAPTINDLSNILRGEALASGWSSLVPIRAQGSGPPFFCFHGAGGNVLIYRALSQHLPEQTFYGLQSQGLDGISQPLTRIEDMAALYVKEIQRVQPTGRYLLGGYCMGGTVALEVAQQLRAQGEEVALLALFDTMNWSRIPLTVWNRTQVALEEVIFHAANFFKLDWNGKAKFLREKIGSLRTRIPVWQGMLLAKFRKNWSNTAVHSLILGRIWQTNDRACWNYVPRPYPGVITDFRPEKQYRIYNRPNLKWDKLALGGQQIVVLPVFPAGMLAEPFVQHLAIALKQCIQKAISDRST